MRWPCLFLTAAWVAAGAIMIGAGCGKSNPPDAADVSAPPAAPVQEPADPALAAKPAEPVPEPTTSDLWQAAERGNVDDVRIFLARGVDLGAKNPRGKTALQVALDTEQDEAAKLLLKQGAELPISDTERQTPLIYAAKRGDRRLAKLLIETFGKVDQTDEIQRTPLVWAAEKGHAEVAVLLLDNGANPNHKSYGNWTALHVAARDGRSEVVDLLVKRGAEVSAATERGESPVFLALLGKHYELADRIVELGGKVPPHANGRGSWLAEAVTAGDVERVRFLAKHSGELEKGVGVVESTPIVLAAEAGKTEIVRALLDAGANVNAATTKDWTALHYAIQRGHLETVQLLVARGADMTRKNNLGKTPPEMNSEVRLELSK